MDEHNVFSEELLKAQHGKKVPLTLEIGGPVIGEATIKYDPETGNLMGRFRVDDPTVSEYLQQDTESVIFRKGDT